MTAFGKSLFLIKYRMRYAIYMPPNTKDLAINQTMVAYGNRQNATEFARANNFDLLRSLKHLMETRLYNRYGYNKQFLTVQSELRLVLILSHHTCQLVYYVIHEYNTSPSNV